MAEELTTKQVEVTHDLVELSRALMDGIVRMGRAQGVVGAVGTRPTTLEEWQALLQDIQTSAEGRARAPMAETADPESIQKGLIEALVDRLVEFGAAPARIYAIQKTGLYMSDTTERFYTELEKAAWESAIAEFKDADISARRAAYGVCDDYTLHIPY